MRIFHVLYFHCKNLFITAVKYMFRIFTGVLPDYCFTINLGKIQSLKGNLSKYKCQKREKCIYKQKIQMFFPINTRIIFILCENYHISFVAIPPPIIYLFPYHPMKINPVDRGKNILYIVL
jgi:hypothetical protein